MGKKALGRQFQSNFEEYWHQAFQILCWYLGIPRQSLKDFSFWCQAPSKFFLFVLMPLNQTTEFLFICFCPIRYFRIGQKQGSGYPKFIRKSKRIKILGLNWELRRTEFIEEPSKDKHSGHFLPTRINRLIDRWYLKVCRIGLRLIFYRIANFVFKSCLAVCW